MKNFKIILTILTVLSLTIYSCSKDDLNNQTNNFEKQHYYPASEALAKQEVFDFLNTTNQYNNIAKSNTVYQNREPNQGNWVMEAASNLLTNGNLNGSDSDTIIKIDIDISNIVELDGTIKMKGEDMSSKFNALHQDIENLENSLNKLANIADYEIKEVTDDRTALLVKLKFGAKAGCNCDTYNGYPNYDVGLVEAQEWLSCGIGCSFPKGPPNIPYPNNNSGPYFYSNIEIHDNGGFGYDIVDQTSYGCSNCLWDNYSGNHISSGDGYTIYDLCFPASEFQTYHNRGISLLTNIKNSLPASSNFETKLVDVEYWFDQIDDFSGAPCNIRGSHKINWFVIAKTNGF